MNVRGFLCLIVGCIAAGGLTNDGWIGYSGTPRIEGKHPTIRMVSEVVHIKVERDSMTADCLFTFKNEGAACSARIGFPDYDSDDYEDPKPKSIFSSFRSYVDGKPVKTSLAVGESFKNWQVKSVSFAKGQTRKVRNVYKVDLGQLTIGGGESSVPMTWQATYVVETGRSWKGTIGSSKVIFDFAGAEAVKSPIKLAKWNQEDSDSDKFWKSHLSTVMWDGFAKPTVSGRQVIFERKNWEPKSDDDDPVVRFGYWFRIVD
jgi:hypothetical protein